MTIQGIIKVLSVGCAGVLASCSSTTSILDRGAAKGKGARPSSQEVLQKLDSNNDGFLSYEEFQARQKKGKAQAERKPLGGLTSDEMKKKRFAAIDTNADQRISAAELAAAPKPKRAR